MPEPLGDDTRLRVLTDLCYHGLDLKDVAAKHGISVRSVYRFQHDFRRGLLQRQQPVGLGRRRILTLRDVTVRAARRASPYRLWACDSKR